MTATATTIRYIGQLTGLTTGLPLTIAATATPGNTVHTYSGGGEDLIELWLLNQSSATVLVHVEWGNATTTNGLVYYVPAYSAILAADRWPLSTGTINIFAGTTGVIAATGKYWNAV